MADRIALHELATLVNGAVIGDSSVEVSDVSHDSRHVNAESLFAAVRGFVFDGHDFVEAAIAAGAPAVLVEDSSVVSAHPAIVVPDVRRIPWPLCTDKVVVEHFGIPCECSMERERVVDSDLADRPRMRLSATCPAWPLSTGCTEKRRRQRTCPSTSRRSGP